eukprot:TRINITY_DN1681_c2_g1_i2.p1 TRINITY_DN1681_c2_g1~~TRINITY_DN1681_c2_g1_i2.p1  ORF type:complete len:862 (+),score=212.22 TRINITY_DN1681_c2_g1_i2:241-2586(+)
MSLRLAKYKGDIQLTEFKAVMLASLRSLVPKDWDTNHEVAWTWLWENVERMLKNEMGKPAVREKALERLIMSLTEDNLNYVRREVYQRFFALAPAGQDYFKQSTTRLYWIADKVVEMTIEIYRDPRKMVEDISALGLRHVGYAIPTEFFAPFVSGAVEVVRALGCEENAEDGFRWGLSLIGRILVRTITEGSTLVMRAINTNNYKQLIKAVSIAPRGKRALELLNITVGTQSISPLYWAIESGSLESARAMLSDLLVIRADRDNYYYGCDTLFERHPDILKVLCQGAAMLIPTLMDGLIWRSRVATNGQRRVNYFVKHLIVNINGGFATNLEWLVDANDPKIICHPSVVLFSDIIWSRLAGRAFFVGKLWFMLTLTIFLISQAILKNMEDDESDARRYSILICRVFVFIGSLGSLVFSHVKKMYNDIKDGSILRIAGRIPLPEYLTNWQDATTFTLIISLMCMFYHEPIYYCLGFEDHDLKGAGTFTETCPEAAEGRQRYSVFSMICMCLYWLLMADFTIFSTRVSSFLLVCIRVLSEVMLFLGAVAFLILTFSSSISAMYETSADFQGMSKAAYSLLAIVLNMFGDENYEKLAEMAILLTTVCVFIIIASIFFVNLLIGQLIGSYNAVYEDMVGFARLNRGKMIVATVEAVSQKTWDKFLNGLALDQRIEFNEGDVGLAGGIQVLEPANANPTTVDAIRRFGGSTSPSQPWPEEEGEGEGDENKFDRLEKLIIRGFAAKTSGKGNSGKGGSSAGLSGSQGGESGSHGEEEEGELEEEGSE